MIRVLIAENRLENRRQLRAVLDSDAEMEVTGMARDEAELVRLAHLLRPDIVLLATELPPTDGFAAAERLTASGLAMESILVTGGCRVTENSLTGDLHRAMRAGAREVLSDTAEPNDFCESVRAVYTDGLRRRSHAAAAESAAHAGGEIIAVSGAKGGIGKTTVAVNLAAALAVDTAEPTVLLDLYTQFGDVALLLNLFPRRTLADLVQVDSADLDLRLLEEHLEQHECGLRVLAGAAVPQPLESLTPHCLDQILTLLTQEYRYVVLDVPPVLHDTTRHALSHADTVLLIANLFDLTTLADTRLWLDALSGLSIDPDAIQIVLNRVSVSNRLQVPDITRTLGHSPPWLILNDGKLVPASVNAGVPFVLSQPASRVAASIFGLVRSLICSPISARPIPVRPGRESLWRFPLRR